MGVGVEVHLSVTLLPGYDPCLPKRLPGGKREIAASLEAYLTQSVFKVVLQESTPPQNSQLHVLITNGKH